MRFRGRPAAFAACSAVSKRGIVYPDVRHYATAFYIFRHTVNSALAFEFLSWNSSSETEYAALAGVATPDSLDMAYANGMEST